MCIPETANTWMVPVALYDADNDWSISSVAPSSSAESTQQITMLVQEAATEAARAVATVKQVADDMRNIEASANATDGMLERISAAMEQQSAAVEEINANVGSLDKIADNNASASDEITATVIELSRVADATRSEVDKFSI